MKYEYNTYRTKSGELDIRFLFVEIKPNDWRAYILTDINYKEYSKARSDLISVTHRLTEFDVAMKRRIKNFIEDNGIPYKKENIRYICWTKTITTLESMRELAKTWSEITDYYIRNGGSFESIQPILKADGTITI